MWLDLNYKEFEKSLVEDVNKEEKDCFEKHLFENIIIIILNLF